MSTRFKANPLVLAAQLKWLANQVLGFVIMQATTMRDLEEGLKKTGAWFSGTELPRFPDADARDLYESVSDTNPDEIQVILSMLLQLSELLEKIRMYAEYARQGLVLCDEDEADRRLTEQRYKELSKKMRALAAKKRK